ncbi:MAG: hypothetical protein AAF921_01440 [Cyanobacteria bacterium P01_D01_bin.44]
MKTLSSDISKSADQPVAERSVNRETTPASNAAQICWIEVKQYPYQPDHQVELLHLQAQADALLLQLQAVQQKRLAAQQLAQPRH